AVEKRESYSAVSGRELFKAVCTVNGVPDAYVRKILKVVDDAELPNWLWYSTEGNVIKIFAFTGGGASIGSLFGAGGMGLGSLIGTWTGWDNVKRTSNAHQRCKEWVDDLKKDLGAELGRNRLEKGAGSDNGITRMNYCFFDLQEGNDPEGHTT